MEGKDVIQVLRSNLPQYVYYEDISFEFKLFLNGTEPRFMYEISTVEGYSKHYSLFSKTGRWKNHFCDNKRVEWLYLNEGFLNSEQLYDAIANCHSFLCANKLIKKSK